MSRLLSSLPVGSRFCDRETTYYGKPIVWLVGEHNHIGYPANTITLISQNIIKLCAFDAKEPASPVNGRNLYGCNRYSKSNIRMWLNSSDARNWYTPAYDFDTPPTSTYTTYNSYASEPGFLYGFSETMNAKIIPTTIRTAVPNIDGDGYEETTDRVFLMSEIEAAHTNQDSGEGYKISLMAAWSGGKTYPTAEAVNHSVREPNLYTGVPWYWIFRTPFTGDGFRVLGTSYGDNTSPYLANNNLNGIRPVINVADDIILPDEPGDDGIYYIGEGSGPYDPDPGDDDEGEDEGQDQYDEYDIGNTSTPPSYTFGLPGEYSQLSAILKGPVKTSSDDNGDGTYTVTLDSDVFDTLKYGKYYLYIEITDNNGKKTTRKVTFTKVENADPVDNPSLVDLGALDRPPVIEFCVSDDDIGQSLTITQKIDDETIDEFTSTIRFSRYHVTVTKDKWDMLASGRHTMTITVTDSMDEQAEKYFSFIKTENQGYISGSGCTCFCGNI